MGVDLLKHNQEAYEKITEAIADGKKKIAISHATGTGKSYLIAKLFEDYSNDKKLVLVPSTYISDQIKKLFEKYSIQNVDVILYQKLVKMNDMDIAAMDYDVVALDEYHHDAATKVWGSKVKTLIETHSETIFFGTSATPIRTDGVNAIDELFEGNCASDLPLSESIAKKIVPLPKYVGALYTLDDELERLRKKVENATNTKEEKQEFYKKINAMRSQIEKSYGMPIILNKNIKDREGKYIVFCKNKKHLAEIKDTVVGWFRTTGCKNINAYEVYSDYENKDAEYKAFCEDTSHSLHLLFCVDMLNEGLHLENISGALLLRPTRSSIVWHQQIGRAIEANNANTPIIIDAVNNFSAVGQGMELMQEIKDAVAKEKESDPDFDDGGFEDIDTFFVLENVIQIQEMFAKIEGRLKGSFEQNVNDIIKYFDSHGYLPKMNSTDRYTRKLANFLIKERINRREAESKGVDYSAYRINKLESIPGFSWNPRKEVFNTFLYYLTEFKKNNNTNEIKNNKVFMNYPIGKQYSNYCYKYKHDLLDDEDRKKFEDIAGEVKNQYEIRCENNYLIAQECIKQGIIITKKNPCFKDVNLYEWVVGTLKSRCDNNKLTDEERKIVKQLIGFDIEEIGKRGIKPILIKVVYNNGDMEDETYSSIKEAASSLSEKLNVTISPCVVGRCLRGTRKNELYGFHFEYVNG